MIHERTLQARDVVFRDYRRGVVEYVGSLDADVLWDDGETEPVDVTVHGLAIERDGRHMAAAPVPMGA